MIVDSVCRVLGPTNSYLTSKCLELTVQLQTPPAPVRHRPTSKVRVTPYLTQRDVGLGTRIMASVTSSPSAIEHVNMLKGTTNRWNVTYYLVKISKGCTIRSQTNLVPRVFIFSPSSLASGGREDPGNKIGYRHEFFFFFTLLLFFLSDMSLHDIFSPHSTCVRIFDNSRLHEFFLYKYLEGHFFQNPPS